MKKNPLKQSGFFNRPILIGVPCCLTVVSLAVAGFSQDRWEKAHLGGPSAGPSVIKSPEAAPTPAPAMTFTVTNTNDSGAGSLRHAVTDSNNNPPPQNMTNLIAFNIPSNDPGCDPATHVCTITLTDCLGRLGNFCTGLNQPVIIDGYTQPGASPNTLAIGDNAVMKIKIIGDPTGDRVIQLCSPAVCGLPNDSFGSTIRGLCLASNPGFHNTLVFVGSNNDVVTGNFLGVDTDGATVVSDGTPVQVGNGSLFANGTTIGGTSPSARNVIVSNGGFALILNDGDATAVQGNYLGTNAAGTAAIGSLATGIDVEEGTGVTIGGSASGADNVINATGNGVSIGGVCFNCAVNTAVQGNLIGMDATGTVAFYALFNGVQIGQSINTTIGGSTLGAANIINARATGIPIGGSPTGVIIQGNKIGTDITGTMPLGNGNCGISISLTSNGTIGGVNPGEGNIIAFNALNGVSIAGFANDNTAWAILGNSIHNNARLGITLATSGCGADNPTPNDHCDPDGGANDLQNYPVITSASFSNGNVVLSGTLDSTSNTTFRLEFFSSAQGDPSGNGEGQTFLGAMNVTTSGDCNASFGPLTFPIPDSQPFITATATRLDAMGNPIETSEFSAFFYHPPIPTGAVSRKTHGGAGTFDINLPLTGNVGIECRSGGATNDYQMIINFATSVTVGSASVSSGTGSVSGFSVSGSQVTVNLTGVTNVQRIAVTLFNVNDGTNRGNVPVPMGMLIGDVNGNASVNATDVAQTKSQVGQPVGMSNFREDVNANGTISATDVAIVKSDVGTSLPP